MIFYSVLCLIGMACQGLFISFDHQKKILPALIFKGLGSVFFISVGFWCYSHSSATELPKIIYGLILGGIGDVLLNLRYFFKKADTPIFLLGAASFLGGHIFYLLHILSNCGNVLLPVIIGLCVAGIMLFIIFKKVKVTAELMAFGILYIGCIYTMAAIGVFRAITVPSASAALFAIGAVLFSCSDTILIFDTFYKKKLWTEISNLSIYYVAQLLIATSLFFC